jgi:hypothetical protein
LILHIENFSNTVKDRLKVEAFSQEKFHGNFSREKFHVFKKFELYSVIKTAQFIIKIWILSKVSEIIFGVQRISRVICSLQ